MWDIIGHHWGTKQSTPTTQELSYHSQLKWAPFSARVTSQQDWNGVECKSRLDKKNHYIVLAQSMQSVQSTPGFFIVYPGNKYHFAVFISESCTVWWSWVKLAISVSNTEACLAFLMLMFHYFWVSLNQINHSFSRHISELRDTDS